MAADTLATLRSCLPTQTPPHTGRVDDYRTCTCISARSEAALNAHALAVLEYHSVIASSDENAEDAR